MLDFLFSTLAFVAKSFMWVVLFCASLTLQVYFLDGSSALSPENIGNLGHIQSLNLPN